MSISGAVIKRFYEQLCQPLLKQLEDPQQAQEECLAQILTRNKTTKFGKQHHFTEIKSIQEYQQNVPITDYNYMQPYVAKTMKGEQNVLFPDPILYFLVTSGTTGNPKLYPFGEYRIRESVYDFVTSALFYVVHCDRYDVIEGKRLVFPAPAMTGQKIGNFDVAFFSGALTVVPLPPEIEMYQMRSRRIPPAEVNNEIDWNKKFYLTARYAVTEDVRSVAGVTSNIVSLLRKISTNFLPQLLKDPKVNSLTKDKLRKAADDDTINLQKLWPNFRVVYSSGVSYTPFERILYDLLGEIDIWEAYLATEATLGTQIYPDKDIIPHINHVFFEFIPNDQEDAVPLPLSDVTTKKPYRILITTSGGFYRYDIGDLIEFTNLDPPELKVIGRQASLVNLAGERMSEELFLRTLERACRRFDTEFVDFALLPEITPDVIRYVLYIEFTRPPIDLKEFTTFVDERLSLANITYAAQRQANVLSLPVIFPVQPNGFELLLQRQKKILGQTKVPRLLTPETSRQIPRINES